MPDKSEMTLNYVNKTSNYLLILLALWSVTDVADESM